MRRLMFTFFALLVGASLGAMAAPPAEAPPDAKPAVPTKPVAETFQDLIAAAEKLSGPIPSADDGSLSARHQFLIGVRLQNGFGVTQDVPAALRWYDRSAARGFAPAQAWAGDFYRYGIADTPIDKPKAAGLYRASATQGWAYAQVELGTQLLVGDGVPVDMAEGEKWLRAAVGRDPFVDDFLPVLDRLPRDPPCREGFCAVLRLAIADAERDFKMLTAGAFNANKVADARYALPGASSCGIVDETDKALRQYVCIFEGPAAGPDDLLPRIRRALALDGGAPRWIATDDSFHFNPGPDCAEDPDDPFSDCSPMDRPAERWQFKPLGYVDYYEYDFDYAKHRDAIPIADRISVKVAPNPWGKGKVVQVFTVPHPDGPIEHHANFILYAYETTISPTYTIRVDGTVVGTMLGYAKGSGKELGLRIRDGSRKIRITDDATGYWEEFDVNVRAIFDHCFYDKTRGINCMSSITQTIAPSAHR